MLSVQNLIVDIFLQILDFVVNKKGGFKVKMASTAQPTSSLKRRDSMPTRESDLLTITPLGAGSEVGRSCVYMTFKGKTVLVCI